MAHAYYERRSFYGLELHNIVSWTGAALFLAPAIAVNGYGAIASALLRLRSSPDRQTKRQPNF